MGRSVAVAFVCLGCSAEPKSASDSGDSETSESETGEAGVFLLEPAAGEAASTLHFRLRGLRPGASHPLSLTVQEADGDRSDARSGTVVELSNGNFVALSYSFADVEYEGEILWRLGDEGDFTLVGDEYWFFHQHSPEWQADGSLLLYDNAVGNPAQSDADAHSRAVR